MKGDWAKTTKQLIGDWIFRDDPRGHVFILPILPAGASNLAALNAAAIRFARWSGIEG